MKRHVKRVVIELETYHALKAKAQKYDELMQKSSEEKNESVQKNALTLKGDGSQNLAFLDTVGIIDSSADSSNSTDSEVLHAQTVRSQIPKQIFVKHVRQKFRSVALDLLNDLDNYPTRITYDNYGIITLDNKTIKGLSLFDVLPALMYKSKKKYPENFEKIVTLLKDLGLLFYVKNVEVKKCAEENNFESLAPLSKSVSKANFSDKTWFQVL